MRIKSFLGLTFALLFAGMADRALAQSVPAASGGRASDPPLAIGAGISGYNPDRGGGHILGGTLWIDYRLPRVPGILRGIGIEVEASDLNYGRSSSWSSQSPNLRQDYARGGVIYSWPHYHNFRPYGKFEMGFGNQDSTSSSGQRINDSRTVTSIGGGVDYRIFRSVWLRADYEYQKWPDMIHKYNIYGVSKPAGSTHPQGITVGALYHF
jgi:opacity protein-like surface antigen